MIKIGKFKMNENKLINSKKIVVVGTSGSGKTTLAKELSKILKIEHIELDGIYWLEDWQGRAKDEFFSIVENKIKKEKWVIDGNYSKVREMIWENADLIIWLNYDFKIVILRSIKRTILRIIKKEKLWSGNVETFSKSFLSKESIILWVLKTYKKRKREYTDLFQESIYKEKLITFNHPDEVKKVINGFSN